MPQLENELGELDTDLGRYSWALRRASWQIAAAAAAGALAGLVLIGGSSYRIEQRVALDSASDVLSSTGLDEAFAETPPISLMRDFLNDPAVVSEAPDDVAVSATLDPTTGSSVILAVTADDQATAVAANAALTESLGEWVGERRQVASDALVTVIDDQRARVQKRLGELDIEISRLTDSDALRDAYLAERGSLILSSLQFDVQEQALQAFTASDRRLAITDALESESNSRPLWLVIGAVLGAMVSVAAVLVGAHLDRRVRSRSDLARLVRSEILPVVPRSGAERDIAESIVRAAIVRIAGDRPAIVVPTDAASHEIASAITASLPVAGVVDRGALPSAASDAAVVLAVAAARTHADDVTRTLSYVESLGLECVAVVLGDVKPGDVRRAAV